VEFAMSNETETGTENEQLDLSDGEQQATGKKSNKLLIIIVVAVVVVIAGGVGGYFLFAGGSEPQAIDEQDKPAEQVVETTTESGVDVKKAHYVSMAPEFVLNLNDASGNSHYISLDITLMTRDEALVEKLKTHKPLIKNDVLAYLSSQSYQQLKTSSKDSQLREKILAIVNQALSSQGEASKVESVLFTNFVME